ncbi:MAG TPA: DUF1592 domain-containing protein [Polyangiaceae bacterium]|nr:DUF1592 domain-containing protein [Polyangiaceae bacterium]
MRESSSFGVVLLAALVGCSGIHERVVSERSSSDAGAGVGQGGVAVNGGSGVSGGVGNSPSAAGTAPVAGVAAGGAAGGGAPTQACAEQPSTLPLRALSSWEFARSVAALTGTAVAANALPSDVTPDASLAEAMDLSPAGVAALLAEAERQGEAARSGQLLPCPIDEPVDDACATQFVANVVGRAFRRPLTAPEQSRYVDLFKAATGTGDFANGVQVVLEGALLSPLFLFKVYLGDPAQAPNAQHPLSPFELASRLSLALTGAPSDSELRAAADKNDLEPGTGLERNVDRLLALPASREAAVHFISTWLGLKELDKLASPDLPPELLASMRGETERFIDDVMRFTGSLTDLLQSSNSFIDRRLADLYGIHSPQIPEQGFIAVTLDSPRGFGILTQSSTLVHFPNPSRRGRFVRERLLCQPVPEPPPNVDRNITVQPTETRRQAWQAHQADAKCASCHSLIDPIGFGLENFDEVARARTTENGLPIDASGELTEPVDGITAGPFNGPGELADRLAHSARVRECVARAWLSYTLERELLASDDCTVQSLLAAFGTGSPNLQSLMRAIVLSHAFRTSDAAGMAMAPPLSFSAEGPFMPAVARQKAVLDLADAEAQWLTPQVEPAGQQVIASYLDSLRQVEQQLGSQGPVGPGPAP